MRILVTGAAGFIGFHLCKALMSSDHIITGLDNINEYYSQKLKYDRLEELGIKQEKASEYNQLCWSSKNDNFCFIRLDIENEESITKLFEKQKFDIVINLAAQAGVRYSIENPKAYIQSNIVGFSNLIENCRNFNIKHLIYASSSSVYGKNTSVPFRTSDKVDTPISLYAASKKSNELIAHTYSHLFKLPTTGLRFFTVYGPWGRPDMAMFLFVDAILNGKEIKVFNYGKMERDFTYVDDIVNGILKIIDNRNGKRSLTEEAYKIYNIGNNNSVKLLDFIEAIEKELNVEAKKNMLPIQKGDVEKTWADVSNLINDYDYSPNTDIHIGVKNFINWYKAYYKTANK